MKTLFALTLLLVATTAFAKDDVKQCKADCKDFIAQCEKSCDTQLKKKGTDPKMATSCKKNCNDFVKQCEKGCENGEF